MERTLNAQQAAAFLSVATKTLQKWDREGLLKPAGRTPTGRRFYTESQLLDFQGRGHGRSRVIAYCRVSKRGQREALRLQRGAIEGFCLARGFNNFEVIEEVGCGLSFRREKLTTIMDAIARREVRALVVAHQDRIARFGIDWFEYFCQQNGCELVVLNQERLSPENELRDDLLSIVQSFASRIDGLDQFQKALRESSLSH